MPLLLLADMNGDVATPLALVRTVADPQNTTEAPVVGAVNVTVTPGTPAPEASVTLAFNWRAKKVSALAICPEPDTATIFVGAREFRAFPHEGAEAPSPEYDARIVPPVGKGPVQLAALFEMVAVHKDASPEEKTTVPIGPAAPVTVAK